MVVFLDICRLTQRSSKSSVEFVLKMGFPLLATALFAVLGSAASIERRATTLIPRTVFDSTANLEQYFTYNYPWGGNTHNGMIPSLISRNITNI
jgi:hypothetical protein